MAKHPAPARPSVAYRGRTVRFLIGLCLSAGLWAGAASAPAAAQQPHVTVDTQISPMTPDPARPGYYTGTFTVTVGACTPYVNPNGDVKDCYVSADIGLAWEGVFGRVGSGFSDLDNPGPITVSGSFETQRPPDTQYLEVRIAYYGAGQIQPPLNIRYPLCFSDLSACGGGTGGGGGGGGGGPTPPGSDPCVSPRRLWGKTPAQRAELRVLAQLYSQNARDGLRLAEDFDLFARLMKAVSGNEGTTDQIDVAAAAIEDLTAHETRLASQVAPLERQAGLQKGLQNDADRRATKHAADLKDLKRQKDAITRRMNSIAPQNQHKKRYRELNQRANDLEQQVKTVDHALKEALAQRAAAARRLFNINEKLQPLAADLKRVRGKLRSKALDLSRALDKTEFGKSLGRIFGALNAAQDTAAVWMGVNAAIAGTLNGLAKPPKGCNETWSPRIPQASRFAAAAGMRATASALQEAFGHVAANRLVSRRQAARMNAVRDALAGQLQAANDLEDGKLTPKERRTAGARLGRLLSRAPAQYRALADALDFDPLPATDPVLAQPYARHALNVVRAGLRRLGASRNLISELGGQPRAVASGALVDPLAVLRSPELAGLGERAVAVLAPG